jgi:hypothetical protein
VASTAGASPAPAPQHLLGSHLILMLELAQALCLVTHHDLVTFAGLDNDGNVRSTGVPLPLLEPPKDARSRNSPVDALALALT